jgi:hypothetical protein
VPGPRYGGELKGPGGEFVAVASLVRGGEFIVAAGTGRGMDHGEVVSLTGLVRSGWLAAAWGGDCGRAVGVSGGRAVGVSGGRCGMLTAGGTNSVYFETWD